MNEHGEQEPALRGALALPEPDENENHLIEVPRERFAVTDFKSADWVVSRIKAAREYGARVKAFYKSEAAKAVAAEAFFLNNYGDQIKSLVKDTTEGTKVKSLNVVAGRLQLRKRPVTLEVVDELTLNMWVEKYLPKALKFEIDLSKIEPRQQKQLLDLLYGDLLFSTCVQTGGVKESFNKSILAEHFKATGEVPPGCELRGGEDELSVQ